MDGLNKRYGRDTITLGSIPQAEHRFSGTKIAFSRIPEKEEFHE
jgi:DNA polymerase-4